VVAPRSRRGAHPRRRLRLTLVAVVAACVAFAVTTLVALEGRDVVVLRTTASDGSTHETRTWIARDDGGWLVEAANEVRPFLHDVRARPAMELRRDGVAHRCVASPLPNPDGHRRIRGLLAEKYGWADCWIALVADTSQSVAVRLDCES
jgi:hypothetical protein